MFFYADLTLTLWRYFPVKCRERIIVARKYINIMRERESLCSRAEYNARARELGARSQIHAALVRIFSGLAQGICLHLKRVQCHRESLLFA